MVCFLFSVEPIYSEITASVASSSSSGPILLEVTLRSMDPNSITMPSKIKGLLPTYFESFFQCLF